jgi:uncharacterized protein (DUF1501 family)
MAGISASPFLLELNTLAAMAQGTGSSGYKALVCVFLQGGNDGHGSVIATDTDSFAAFTQARSGAPGLAYPLGNLLPITLKTPQSGRTFALNPALGGIQNLFNAGRAAIVANTGTLIAPATKAQVNANSVPLPASLFSHFDQTAAWQAIAANGGSAEHVGWGGSVADVIESMSMNSNSTFTCISTAGIALFLSGQSSFQLNVTSAGPIPIYGLSQPPFGLPSAANPLAAILTADESNLFAKEYEVVVNRSTQAQAQLARSMLPAGVGGIPNPPQYLDPRTNMLTDNSFATSLQTVARIIAGSGGLGVTRQIFYVQLGSFDTHDGQAVTHAQLLTQLGQGLEYFDGLMVAAGMGSQVTSFTASDFGRRLGKPPFRCRRRGAGAGYVRRVSSRRRQPGQRCGSGPADSKHVGGPICGDAGAVVWAVRRAGPADFSELRQLRFKPVFGVYGIAKRVAYMVSNWRETSA